MHPSYLAGLLCDSTVSPCVHFGMPTASPYTSNTWWMFVVYPLCLSPWQGLITLWCHDGQSLYLGLLPCLSRSCHHFRFMHINSASCGSFSILFGTKESTALILTLKIRNKISMAHLVFLVGWLNFTWKPGFTHNAH